MEAEVYGEASRTSSKVPCPRAFPSGSSSKLPRRWRLEEKEKGGVFELEKQGGSHELKEKEMGNDPDSHILKVMSLPSESDTRTNLVPW